MAARRDLSLAEMEVIAELASATPDLVAARERLLAALTEPSGPARGGGRDIKPSGWKELMEGVRLGVLSPEQARRFLHIPQAEPGVLARLARLRWQRGGIF
ncbi:MAG: hypothetical protein ACYDC5_11020 [Candidatus Dormibacteria bacterium]